MLQDILDNWSKQRGNINELDEAQLKTLIGLELKGSARNTVVVKAHQRQCKLRAARERQALETRVEKAQARLARNQR